MKQTVKTYHTPLLVMEWCPSCGLMFLREGMILDSRAAHTRGCPCVFFFFVLTKKIISWTAKCRGKWGLRRKCKVAWCGKKKVRNQSPVRPITGRHSHGPTTKSRQIFEFCKILHSFDCNLDLFEYFDFFSELFLFWIQIFEYIQVTNRINRIIGCHVMRPCHALVFWQTGAFWNRKSILEEPINFRGFRFQEFDWPNFGQFRLFSSQSQILKFNRNFIFSEWSVRPIQLPKNWNRLCFLPHSWSNLSFLHRPFRLPPPIKTLSNTYAHAQVVLLHNASIYWWNSQIFSTSPRLQFQRQK